MNAPIHKSRRAPRSPLAQIHPAAPDRRPAIRHLLRGPRPQAKLLVGRADDPAEQEAERVAEAVTRESASAGQGSCACADAPAPCPRCAQVRNAGPMRPAEAGMRARIIRRSAQPSVPSVESYRSDRWMGSGVGGVAEGGSPRRHIALRRTGDGPQDDAGGCTPARRGIPPTPANCREYVRNAWWLPQAYVNNATCACLETPHSTTANCVREFLQDRLRATPAWLKTIAAVEKPLEVINPSAYQVFVQTVLTPRIYRDHVDAYRACCCPSGPAPYPAWMGVTSVPLPCPLVGESIRRFGSCHGTPGAW